MKAQIMLERFVKPRALKVGPSPRPWAAEVLPGTRGQLWDRRYLKAGGNDYRDANGCGTRGVRRHFVLESGKLYEVQQMTGWDRTERVFMRVTESGDIEELERSEVLSWLRSKV
jgi:hypothetical protein